MWLLHLPWKLMRLAGEYKDKSPEEAARMALAAVAIVIELYCPLRLLNLTHLRLGQNVVFDRSTGKRIEKLLVPLHDNKTGELYEWPLDRDAAELVEHGIREFRSVLGGEH